MSGSLRRLVIIGHNLSLGLWRQQSRGIKSTAKPRALTANVHGDHRPERTDIPGANNPEPAAENLRSRISDGGSLDTSKEVENFFLPYQKADGDVCSEPYNYTASLPGKQSLVKYIDILSEWLPVPESSVNIIREVAVRLVNISLLLDDIQDGSDLRRGSPAAYIVYGSGQTINSGIYILMKAAESLDRLHSEKCRKIFYEESQNIIAGQGLDLYWRSNAICPTFQQYTAMVDNKTGGFFRVVTGLMMEKATAPPKCTEFSQLVTLIGRYYQIRDDYQNLASEQYTATKGFCDDLSEGKFSLPLIHFLQNAPTKSANKVRQELFRQGRTSLSTSRIPLSLQKRQEILLEMRKAGSLEFVKAVLLKMQAKMLVTLTHVERDMGDNHKLRDFFQKLKISS